MGLKTAIPGKCAFFRGLCERIRNKSGIFALVNLKNQSLCLYKKFPAGIVSVQPAKFIPQKHKRNNRPAQFMRPGIVKSPHPKRNKGNFRKIPLNSLSLLRLFTHRIAQQRYFDRPAGIRPGGVLFNQRTKRNDPMRFPGFPCNNTQSRTRKHLFSGMRPQWKRIFPRYHCILPVSLVWTPGE